MHQHKLSAGTAPHRTAHALQRRCAPAARSLPRRTPATGCSSACRRCDAQQTCRHRARLGSSSGCAPAPRSRSPAPSPRVHARSITGDSWHGARVFISVAKYKEEGSRHDWPPWARLSVASPRFGGEAQRCRAACSLRAPRPCAHPCERLRNGACSSLSPSQLRAVQCWRARAAVCARMRALRARAPRRVRAATRRRRTLQPQRLLLLSKRRCSTRCRRPARRATWAAARYARVRSASRWMRMHADLATAAGDVVVAQPLRTLPRSRLSAYAGHAALLPAAYTIDAPAAMMRTRGADAAAHLPTQPMRIIITGAQPCTHQILHRR